MHRLPPAGLFVVETATLNSVLAVFPHRATSLGCNDTQRPRAPSHAGRVVSLNADDMRDIIVNGDRGGSVTFALLIDCRVPNVETHRTDLLDNDFDGTGTSPRNLDDDNDGLGRAEGGSSWRLRARSVATATTTHGMWDHGQVR